MVARCAQALAVPDPGRAALVVRTDVVGVPDRCIAPGGAARLVAQPDELVERRDAKSHSADLLHVLRLDAVIARTNPRTSSGSFVIVSSRTLRVE